ncbi:MAG: hypothetical protein KDK30_11080 [Leptospiraceae bacterium]|nr:hypothetical protein [Leptospiraceae bacterium]
MLACKPERFEFIEFHSDGLAGVLEAPDAADYYKFDYDFFGNPEKITWMIKNKPAVQTKWTYALITTSETGWSIKYYDHLMRPASYEKMIHEVRYTEGAFPATQTAEEIKTDSQTGESEVNPPPRQTMQISDETESTSNTTNESPENDAADSALTNSGTESNKPNIDAESNRADSEGMLTFYNHHGQPVNNVDLVYRQAFQWNSDGFALSRKNLDRENNPIQSFLHIVHETRYARDAINRIVQISHYDMNGSSTMDRWNDYQTAIISYKEKSDTDEQVQTIRFLDADENPTVPSKSIEGVQVPFVATFCPVSEIIFKENVIRRFRCMDDESELRSIPGSGPEAEENTAVMIEYAHDEQNRPTRVTYLDSRESPTMHSQYAIRTIEYNQDGWQSGIRYFDPEMKPINFSEYYPVHYEKYTFDSRGVNIGETCFDLKGEAAICRDGWHERREETNEKGETTSIAYFDGDGKPVVAGSEEVHKVMYRYSPGGTKIEESFYDIEGKPTVGAKQKCHRVVTAVTDEDYIAGFAFYDIENKPATHPEYASHRVEFKDFNEYGQARRILMFDGDDKRMNFSASKCGEHRTVHNEYGDTTELSFFDLEGNPCNHEATYAHIHRYEYDARGNRIHEAFFNKEGEPMTAGTVNVHQLRYEYDNSGRQTSKAFYDLNGNPAANGFYTHRMEWLYNEDGTLQSYRSYSAPGVVSYTHTY